MHMRLYSIVLAAALAVFTASHAPAATVYFLLDFPAPGNFELIAYTSFGDNVGLASYSVPLIGTVTTLDNRTPIAVNQNSVPVGFTQFRLPAADSTNILVNPTVRGAQNTISGPIDSFIYDFGQAPSSWAANGVTPVGSSDPTHDNPWQSPLVLATGTYTGTLGFNFASVDLGANVFAAEGQRATPVATVFADRLYGITIIYDGYINRVNASDPGAVSHTFSYRGIAPPTMWSDFAFESYEPALGTVGSGPAIPATFDPATHTFDWSTVGSQPGLYTWRVIASRLSVPPDVVYMRVRITAVPEPTTLSLGVAIAAGISFVRRRCA
jgi:hypothetical protein